MIPSLHFLEGGWCAELGASYSPGVYQPKTKAEFEDLAPFAVDAPELEAEPVKRGPGRPKAE